MGPADPSLSNAALFLLRGVVADYRLVHGEDGVQHGKRAVVDGGDKLYTNLHRLLFLVIRKKFWHLSC